MISNEITVGEFCTILKRAGLRATCRIVRRPQSRLAWFGALVSRGISPCLAARVVTWDVPS